MLKKLVFRPGLFRDLTRYATEGTWYDAQWVRFVRSFPQKMGGWANYLNVNYVSPVLGTIRSMYRWYDSNNGAQRMGFGTERQFYVETAGGVNNITPYRPVSVTLSAPLAISNTSTTMTITHTAHGAATGAIVSISGATSGVTHPTAAEVNTDFVITVTGANTYTVTLPVAATATNTAFGGTAVTITYRAPAILLTNPFAVTNGSTTMTVTHTAHGAIDGAGITITGASSALTHPTTAELNADYIITYVDADHYTVTLPVAATAPNAAFGGTSVLIKYEVNPGNAISSASAGWGTGAFGTGGYGIGTGSGSVTTPLRLWSQDDFGAYLLVNPRGGSVSVYTNSGRAVDISSLVLDAPKSAYYAFVSDLERYVILLGTNDTLSSAFDPLLIRWADQESYLTWTPDATNSAGSLPVGDGDYLVCGTHTLGQNLIWTTDTLYSLNFIGGQAVFGLQLIARNISILSQNAFVATRDRVFWMGNGTFYVYDGMCRTLPCPLQQTIFNNFNMPQAAQVYAGEIRKYNEVIWFYCSGASSTNDRYVIYNYLEDIWYDGAISRTAWLDSADEPNPIGANGSSLYYHEIGVDDTSSGSPVAIPAYIQSADTDIDDGNSLMFVKRMVPDIDFTGSTGGASVTMSAVARFAPGDSASSGSDTSSPVTASANVLQYTDQIWIRLRGRQMALRVESAGLGVAWRLGAPRIDAQPDGRR